LVSITSRSSGLGVRQSAALGAAAVAGALAGAWAAAGAAARARPAANRRERLIALS
jgi:hypothetical protein